MYDSAMIDSSIAAKLESAKDEPIDCFRTQLRQFQPRDDYKELLQIALLFLGVPAEEGQHILAPGAYHQARWMAKLIYCLKIYIFRSQFNLTTRELSSLREFNVFVVLIYLKAWYTCQCFVSAPHNDLTLLKQLATYETNQTVDKAAMTSFSGHLWYLNETHVRLAFFDSRVFVDVKVAMMAALESGGTAEPPRRIKLDREVALQSQLSDFVIANTTQLFQAFDIAQNFLQQHPSTWEQDDSYLSACNKLQKLKVVNDAAERGVALIQSFNAVLTNQEKQYLLQIVEKHRNEFPKCNKTIVTNQ